MQYAYIRVSTKEQNIDRQMLALEPYHIPKKNIYCDYQSGRDFQRPEYQKLIKKLKAGDLLIIKSIDRLGRNYNDILVQWQYLTKEIKAEILVLDMELLDTRQKSGNLTGTLIADLVYKVLKDGLSVEFTKPITKKASVKIPDIIKASGVTCKVTGISANAFKNQASLKTVSIGKNVNTIGNSAFYGCKKLSKITGGNGVVKIGDNAFGSCGSLSSITIAGSVRSIGKQAFYNCKKLKSIVVNTVALTDKNIGAKAFTGTYVKPTVKVPTKQLKAYQKLLKSKGMSSKAVYKK